MGDMGSGAREAFIEDTMELFGPYKIVKHVDVMANATYELLTGSKFEGERYNTIDELLDIIKKLTERKIK